MAPIEDMFVFATETAPKLFPDASAEQIIQMAEAFDRFFSPGYSPSPEEWEKGTTGVGSGACAIDYLAYIGKRAINQMPNKAELTEPWGVILEKVLTI